MQSKYNKKIKPLSECCNVAFHNIKVILACENVDIYSELKLLINKYCNKCELIEFPSMKKLNEEKDFITKCGKYSYGPLCNHRYVESVGNFCSFATGSDVVNNHAIEFISTHPFIFYDKSVCQVYDEYKDRSDEKWYFDLGKGEKPLAKPMKTHRVIIGHDVWLGKNVTITTNVSTIGNGVIAAAGAVITKDVPDYAIVGGVPARIIRFRYTEEQISLLNKIKWWDWPDDVIRARYRDFFIPVDDFIKLYAK